MSIKAVLFDLDGTLLPMDQEKFIKGYFYSLTEGMAKRGFDPDRFSKALLYGVGAMMKNKGEDTNENVFWSAFESLYGEKARVKEELFMDFYNNEFQSLENMCGKMAEAADCVRAVSAMGLRTILATNPVFPAIAVESRIRWAGLAPSDFELYTNYSNSRYAKPAPEYYLGIASALGLEPSECLMVGNDPSDDMIAETVGMKVFLLPEYLVNMKGVDITPYRQGTFADLLTYINEIK